jgi:hypothetical protein
MNEDSSFFPSYSLPLAEPAANAGSLHLTDDYGPPPASFLFQPSTAADATTPLMEERRCVQEGTFRTPKFCSVAAERKLMELSAVFNSQQFHCYLSTFARTTRQPCGGPPVWWPPKRILPFSGDASREILGRRRKDASCIGLCGDKSLERIVGYDL